MHPPLPASGSDLDIAGFSIGHGTDIEGRTGVTVILCPEEGATAAAEVRGSATGTRQFDSLVLPTHLATRVHAVVLSGGSAFGHRAADPVLDRLAEEGRGFGTGRGVVPLVPTAILFDLGLGERPPRPREELALDALDSASSGPIPVGSVGAGTGATVGKARGFERGMKGGFGFVSLRSEGGPTVAAAVAANPFGDVFDPEDGHLLAGCRTSVSGLELADARRVLAGLPAEADHPWEGNTTLAVFMTDALLDKTALLAVCRMAFGAFHRVLSPALTLYDGDLVVGLAAGRVPCHLHRVAVLAEEAVARAIVRGVRSADGLGLLPSVRDLRKRR